MCSDLLYQLRSHKRHFVKFVLCLVDFVSPAGSSVSKHLRFHRSNCYVVELTSFFFSFIFLCWTGLWRLTTNFEGNRRDLFEKDCQRISVHELKTYVGYSESKYRLRISLAHPRDCPFAYLQWLPLPVEKPQTPFREIRVMFMFVPVR